jgi:hypothetical protein
MGYTHYWYRKKIIDEDIFKNIVDDFKKLLNKTNIPTLLADWNGDGEPDIDYTEVRFNGKQPEDDHETFVFEQNMDIENKISKEGKYFVFCKTARKPYDIAVTTFLLIAKYYLGDDIKVSSDGIKEDWNEADVLVRHILKYDVLEEIDL